MADAEEKEGKQNISMSVPIGGIATLVVLGLATAGYLVASRNSEPEGAVERARSSGRAVRRRLGLMTLVTLIENDTTRKVLVALLRAMARRG